MYRAHLANEAATLAFGAALAPTLRAGDVIALYGGLGAGKTTLTRGLLTELIGDIEVPSPTFTLVQTYVTSAFDLWHFDLYRLTDPEELVELAWDEAAEGVCIIEWPEKAGGKLPDWRLDIVLEPESEGRIVTLEPRGEDWQKRLNDESHRFPRAGD